MNRTCECPNYGAWADVHLPHRGGNLHLVGAEGCVAAKRQPVASTWVQKALSGTLPAKVLA